MGAKISKRGSYNLEKREKKSKKNKGAKLEERTTSFISLTQAQIYEDSIKSPLPDAKHQSFENLYENNFVTSRDVEIIHKSESFSSKTNSERDDYSNLDDEKIYENIVKHVANDEEQIERKDSGTIISLIQRDKETQKEKEQKDANSHSEREHLPSISSYETNEESSVGSWKDVLNGKYWSTEAEYIDSDKQHEEQLKVVSNKAEEQVPFTEAKNNKWLVQGEEQIEIINHHQNVSLAQNTLEPSTMNTQSEENLNLNDYDKCEDRKDILTILETEDNAFEQIEIKEIESLATNNKEENIPLKKKVTFENDELPKLVSNEQLYEEQKEESLANSALGQADANVSALLLYHLWEDGQNLLQFQKLIDKIKLSPNEDLQSEQKGLEEQLETSVSKRRPLSTVSISSDAYYDLDEDGSIDESDGEEQELFYDAEGFDKVEVIDGMDIVGNIKVNQKSDQETLEIADVTEIQSQMSDDKKLKMIDEINQLKIAHQKRELLEIEEQKQLLLLQEYDLNANEETVILIKDNDQSSSNQEYTPELNINKAPKTNYDKEIADPLLINFNKTTIEERRIKDDGVNMEYEEEEDSGFNFSDDLHQSMTLIDLNEDLHNTSETHKHMSTEKEEETNINVLENTERNDEGSPQKAPVILDVTQLKFASTDFDNDIHSQSRNIEDLEEKIITYPEGSLHQPPILIDLNSTFKSATTNLSVDDEPSMEIFEIMPQEEMTKADDLIESTALEKNQITYSEDSLYEPQVLIDLNSTFKSATANLSAQDESSIETFEIMPQEKMAKADDLIGSTALEENQTTYSEDSLYEPQVLIDLNSTFKSTTNSVSVQDEPSIKIMLQKETAEADDLIRCKVKNKDLEKNQTRYSEDILYEPQVLTDLDDTDLQSTSIKSLKEISLKEETSKLEDPIQLLSKNMKTFEDKSITFSDQLEVFIDLDNETIQSSTTKTNSLHSQEKSPIETSETSLKDQTSSENIKLLKDTALICNLYEPQILTDLSNPTQDKSPKLFSKETTLEPLVTFNDTPSNKPSYLPLATNIQYVLPNQRDVNPKLFEPSLSITTPEEIAQDQMMQWQQQKEEAEEVIEEITAIITSINLLKIQIATLGASEEDTEIQTKMYQTLFKIMRDVNNINNHDFNEKVIELQHAALNEINGCFKDLQSKAFS